MKTFHSSIEPLESRIAPATIVVNSVFDNGSAGTLRWALAQANTDLIAHPGVVNTITFHIPTAQMNGTGAWDIQLNAAVGYQTLTSLGNVTITGPGAGKLIIDGAGKYQVFNFNDGVATHDSPVTVSGLTIENGKTSGNGGGIYSFESLTLKNVVISGNTSGFVGGGVNIHGNSTAGTHVSISNSLISGNSASATAGGLNLYAVQLITISDTVVTGNAAGSAAGGGIYANLNSTGKGITITDCQISGNTAGYGGGLVLKDYNTAPASKITISGTKVTGNISTDSSGKYGGGGVYVKAGNAVITGCTISDNTAVYDGGGIEARDFTSLTISSSTITGNQTTTTNGTSEGGGGVFIQGSGSITPLPVKITGSLITDNHSAIRGGGLFAHDGIALTISGSTISGNHAVDDGGGVYTTGSGANKVNLTIAGGTFSDNVAALEDGGGIYAASNGVVSMTASKVTGNISGNDGGGIFISSTAAVTVKKVAATGNFSSGFGGGLYINTPDFHVSGGSFTGNCASEGGGIDAYNAAGSILGVTITGNAAISKGGGVFNGGGSPGTVMLQIATVICNTAPSDANYFGTTPVGSAAHAPAPGHGTFVVTNTSDDVNMAGSLPWALAQADKTPTTVDTIAFAITAAQVNGAWTIPLTSGLTSLGNVNIVGPGAGKLIIDGMGNQILNIDDGSGTTDSPVTISGLSLINGNASGAGSLGNGGAIYSTESLTLKNCTISGNSAKFTGGGVCALPSDTANTAVNVINSLISGNTADAAAGFKFSDAAGLTVGANKTVLISGCTITGNTNQGYNGGVFAEIISTAGAGSGMTISNDLIAGNSAAYAGGGLAVQDHNSTFTPKGAPVSKITISSSTISGNSVTGTNAVNGNRGGGIYCYDGNVVLSKVTISNNTAVGGGGGIEATSATSLTITGGSIDGNNVSNGTGGGIDIASGSAPLTVKGALITGNHSSDDGGGIYLNTSGAVHITGSTVNANRVDGTNAGGGLASVGTGAITISGGQFSFNNQNGIFVYQGTDVTIQSAQITGNTAVGEGGGAYLNASGAINVISTIISGNQATSNGGGFCLGGSGTFTLKSDTIAGNATGDNGGGIFAGPSLKGSVIGTKINGNVASSEGGGIYNDATVNFTPGSGELALISGNSAPTDPNTFGF